MPISVDRSEAPICSTSMPSTAAIASAFSTASGCLDHRHQQRLFVEDLTDLRLRDGGIAELWAAAESRAMAPRRIETSFNDRLGLGGVLDVRHHDPLRAAIAS